VEIDTPRSTPQDKPMVEDDLTEIKGIGPKVSQALKTAGIRNFHQLALAGEQRLRSILKEANASIVDPSSWGEQAHLAAQGKWSQLEDLQKQI